MRLEMGAITAVIESDDDVIEFIKGLLRYVSNKELGGILGLSEKTVKRWKESGRLPATGNQQTALLELLIHIKPEMASKRDLRNPEG